MDSPIYQNEYYSNQYEQNNFNVNKLTNLGIYMIMILSIFMITSNFYVQNDTQNLILKNAQSLIN